MLGTVLDTRALTVDERDVFPAFVVLTIQCPGVLMGSELQKASSPCY